MLRICALASLLLLLPAIAPAEDCTRVEGAWTRAGDLDAERVAPADRAEGGFDRISHDDIPFALLVQRAPCAPEASPTKGDAPPATFRIASGLSALLARAIGAPRRDAPARHRREYLSYDATAPPIG